MRACKRYREFDFLNIKIQWVLLLWEYCPTAGNVSSQLLVDNSFFRTELNSLNPPSVLEPHYNFMLQSEGKLTQTFVNHKQEEVGALIVVLL